MPRKKKLEKSIEALGNFILNLFGGVCPDCKKYKTFLTFDKREWSVCDHCLSIRHVDFMLREQWKKEKEKEDVNWRNKLESTQHGLRGGK